MRILLSSPADFSSRLRVYRGAEDRVRWCRNSADLAEIFSRAEILFVTGGLGPTTDDVTREEAAELLGLKLIRDPGSDVRHPGKIRDTRHPIYCARRASGFYRLERRC